MGPPLLLYPLQAQNRFLWWRLLQWILTTSMTTITITSLDRCDDSSHCTTMKEEVLDINSSITHFDPVASRWFKDWRIWRWFYDLIKNPLDTIIWWLYCSCTEYIVYVTAESTKGSHQPIKDEVLKMRYIRRSSIVWKVTHLYRRPTYQTNLRAASYRNNLY